MDREKCTNCLTVELEPRKPAGAFADRRVFLHTSDSSYAALCGKGQTWDTGVFYFQDEDGPTHMIVGPRAANEKVQLVATRLGVSPRVLRHFRDEAGHD
jgi:hypothetical protein